MPIISVEIMKIIDENKSVIQSVSSWHEVIVKCN